MKSLIDKKYQIYYPRTNEKIEIFLIILNHLIIFGGIVLLLILKNLIPTIILILGLSSVFVICLYKLSNYFHTDKMQNIAAYESVINILKNYALSQFSKDWINLWINNVYKVQLIKDNKKNKYSTIFIYTTSIDNPEIEEENLTKTFSNLFGYDISVKILEKTILFD